MKNTKRKGFNFFRSYFDVYNELENNEDKVAFIDALLERQFLGVKPENLKGMSRFAWISQVNSIDSQVKGWEDKTGLKLTPTEGGSLRGKNNPTEQLQVEEEVKEEVKLQVKEKMYFKKEIHDTFENCLNYFPEHLHPKNEKIKNSWLDTIKKLNEIEKLPFEKIIEIVEKTRKDDFWSKNFLSLQKLRKKNKEGVLYIVVFNEQIKGPAQKSLQDKIKHLM